MTSAEYLRVLIARIRQDQQKFAEKALRSGAPRYEDYLIAVGQFRARDSVIQMLTDSLRKHESGEELDLPPEPGALPAAKPEESEDDEDDVGVELNFRPRRSLG